VSGDTEVPEPGPLRHGRRQVGVSTLASQWYCELKIELKHLHPEIRALSPALDLGTEGHERLSAGARPITRLYFEKDVAECRELYLQESRFEAEIDGVPVVGVPDLVHLQGRRCDLVLEMKFSRRPALYVDRYVQAQTYGLLLAQNGFDMARTACVIGIVPSPVEGARDEKLNALRQEGVLHRILDRCWSLAEQDGKRWAARGVKNPLTLQEGPVTLQAFPFRSADVREHLGWAFDFWKSRRGPEAATTPAKCKVCPYNAAGVCGSAKARPDRAFRIRTIREEGREFLEVTLTR